MPNIGYDSTPHQCRPGGSCRVCNGPETPDDPVLRLIEGVMEAIAILDNGSEYERKHVSTILSAALESYYEQSD